MIFEDITIHGVAVLTLTMFFFLVIIRLHIMMEILDYMKENFSIFHNSLTHGTNESFHTITSGKSWIINFKLLFSKTYQLDENLKIKINMYKIATVLKNLLLILLIYLIIELEIIVIPKKILFW